LPQTVPSLARFRGCLLGGAIGDSLGEPIEFEQSACEITRRFGTRAPEKRGYAHGPFITDDSQMTLFTAEGRLRAEVRLGGLELRCVIEEVARDLVRVRLGAFDFNKRRYPGWQPSPMSAYGQQTPGWRSCAISV